MCLNLKIRLKYLHLFAVAVCLVDQLFGVGGGRFCVCKVGVGGGEARTLSILFIHLSCAYDDTTERHVFSLERHRKASLAARHPVNLASNQ